MRDPGLALAMLARLSALGFLLVLVAGCEQESRPGNAHLIVERVDTLISTESGLLGAPVDIVATASGAVAIADFQSQHITVVGPDGSVRTLGKGGEGPGEFDGVWALQADGQELLVVDRGNGRVQRIRSDGTFVESWPVSPLVRASFPYLQPDGVVLLGTMGRDDVLAYAFDPGSEEPQGFGVPVAPVPERRDFSVIRDAIDRGQIPDQIRNEVLVAGQLDGRAWLAVQTEGVLQQFGPDRQLEWSVQLNEPEMDEIRAEFFAANQAEENRRRYYSLRYFSDLLPVGDELWILLTSLESARSARVLVYGTDGGRRRSIEVAGAAGANGMALDPARDRLFLSTAHNAQLLVADLGGGG